MKTIVFTQFEPSRTADVAQASDRFWTSPPPGIKRLGVYTLAGPLPVQLPGQACTVSILEAESEQALLGLVYNVALGGASVASITAMELPVGPELVKT
jgi:hypothetical protein